jgi:hypothetical protein
MAIQQSPCWWLTVATLSPRQLTGTMAIDSQTYWQVQCLHKVYIPHWYNVYIDACIRGCYGGRLAAFVPQWLNGFTSAYTARVMGIEAPPYVRYNVSMRRSYNGLVFAYMTDIMATSMSTHWNVTVTFLTPPYVTALIATMVLRFTIIIVWWYYSDDRGH